MEIISAGEKRRVSIAPTPKKNGSPLASTQTGLPRQASIASSASSIGDGQTSVSAASGPASARWRRPPTTKAACARRRRAAGVRPSAPSSPRPMTESHRVSLMEPPPEAAQPAHSRRHVRSERARAPSRRRPRSRPRSCRSRARPRSRRPRRSPSGSAASAAPRASRRSCGAERIDAIVDATHPFASRMSANAVAAARATGTPLVVFSRPPWAPQEGDRWIEVASIEDAVEALGSERKTVFLTQGRLQLAAFARAPQHYLPRAGDRPAGRDRRASRLQARSSPAARSRSTTNSR